MRRIRPTVLVVLMTTSVVLAKDKERAFYSYPLDEARINAAITIGNEAGGRSTSLTLRDSAQSWARALGDQQATTGFSLEVFTPFSWIAQNA